MSVMHVLVLVAGAAVLGPSCAEVQEGAQPARQPATSGAVTGERAGPVAEFKNADELLTALEESGKDLVSLTAGLKYDKTFEMMGDRQIRTGKLYFLGGKPDPERPERRIGRKFAIQFEQLWLGSEKRPDDRLYVFDGEWLIEKLPSEKLVLRKLLVGPGETFDPLRIGEGPLPIPIGQPKADILARYNVELLPGPEGIEPAREEDEPEVKREAETMAQLARDAWQLKLVPKPERAREDQFREIRLWYRRGRDGQLLPRMARTVNKSGDVSVVQLYNVETQLEGGAQNAKAAIPAEVFNVETPEGWVEDVQDLRPGAARER